MNRYQLLAELREVLDDVVTVDAGWSDARLYSLLAEGERDFARRTSILVDSSSFNFATQDAVDTYALSNKVVAIKALKEGSRTLEYMNAARREDHGIEYGLAYPSHATATAYTIGQRVNISISGSSEYLVLACAVAGTTDASAPTPTASDIGTTITDGTVTWKVDNYYRGSTGIPTYFETDIGTMQLHLYPCPDGVYVLSMEAVRLPLVDIDKDNDPEVPTEFHRALINYAAARALKFRDDEVNNLRLAQTHEQEYERHVWAGKSYVSRRSGPHPGIHIPRGYRC